MAVGAPRCHYISVGNSGGTHARETANLSGMHPQEHLRFRGIGTHRGPSRTVEMPVPENPQSVAGGIMSGVAEFARAPKKRDTNVTQR